MEEETPYPVQMAFLSTELEPVQDGQLLAVECANLAGSLRVDFRARRIADVLAEPHAAERLLQSVHVIPVAASLPLIRSPTPASASAAVPLPLPLVLLLPPVAASARTSATVALPLPLALFFPLTATMFPWGPHNLKATLDPHDVVPVVVLVLEPPCCFQIHVERLSQEACVKAAEDVVASTPLLALLTAAEGLASSLFLLVLRVASEEESLKAGEKRELIHSQTYPNHACMHKPINSILQIDSLLG